MQPYLILNAEPTLNIQDDGRNHSHYTGDLEDERMSPCPVCDSASDDSTAYTTDDSDKTKQPHLHVVVALRGENKTCDGDNGSKHGKVDTKDKDQQQIVSALEHHLDTLSECNTAHCSTLRGWNLGARGQKEERDAKHSGDAGSDQKLQQSLSVI